LNGHTGNDFRLFVSLEVLVSTHIWARCTHQALMCFGNGLGPYRLVFRAVLLLVWGQELAPSRPNHPRGVRRTEYNRRLGSRRRPPGGAAPPTRVCGGSGAGFGTGARRQLFRRRNANSRQAQNPVRERTGLPSTPFGGAVNQDVKNRPV
jgi:hypothetical protein